MKSNGDVTLLFSQDSENNFLWTFVTAYLKRSFLDVKSKYV